MWNHSAVAYNEIYSHFEAWTKWTICCNCIFLQESFVFLFKSNRILFPWRLIGRGLWGFSSRWLTQLDGIHSCRFESLRCPQISRQVAAATHWNGHFEASHYIDVIMTTMASQITGLTIVYSTVYLDADQSKHQSSASLAFVWGIHRDRWIPRTNGQ